MYWQATPCADSIVSSLQYGHEHTALAEPINSDVTSLCDVALHIPCELNSSMTMYVGEGREGSQGGALSMWTHASVHIDCVCFLIMNSPHIMWYGNKYSVALSHAVWTHETNIAQCPQIHTSQLTLEGMLSVLCMHSMWCQCILCTTSCACRLCVCLEISLQAQENSAVLVISKRCAYIASI